MTPAALKGVLITFLDWVNDGNALDFDLLQVNAMAAALVAAGILTAEELSGLRALGDVPQRVAALDVEFVRTRLR